MDLKELSKIMDTKCDSTKQRIEDKTSEELKGYDKYISGEITYEELIKLNENED